MKKILFITATFILLIGSTAFCASAVKAPGFTKCTVNASKLNVRSGPGTGYAIVKSVVKGTELKAIGKINGWYLVQANDDTVGMVSGWYITPVKSPTANNNIPKAEIDNSEMTADEKEIFNLVNNARKNAGLSELKLDKELLRTARIKSQDMVDNSYFSHTSPIYGTPFQMIKNFGISYTSAGENIAGNSSVKGAFDAWMNSPGHKANILGGSFEYTGIGIASSPKYGKIFTQMFIGK